MKKRIIYHLLPPFICLFFTACQLGDTNLIASKKEADTVVIHFYNASVAPDYQFYNTIQIVKDTYHITTQKGNGGIADTIKGVLPDGSWQKLVLFEPSKLNEKNNGDGETLMIEYHCKDSIYTHFLDHNSPSWAQITRLFQLHK